MISVLLGLAYLLLLLAKSLSAHAYRRRQQAPIYSGNLAEVAILQPILSGDPGLETMLASNVQGLSGAHFYWLVDCDDQPAQAVAEQLRRAMPEANITVLLFDAAPQGVNPKVHKLQPALLQCTEPFVVVLDDDTQLADTSLRALLGALTEAEIATGLPHYLPGTNLASNLLATFVNNNAAMTYLATLPFLAPVTINGMCYALKRDTLVQWGGFAPIARHLTDDLALAEKVLSEGGRIAQLPCRQQLHTQLANLPAYFSQMHRWYVFAQLLFNRKPWRIKSLMLLLYAMPPLLFSALLVATLWEFSWVGVSVLLLTLIVRHKVLIGHQPEGERLGFFLSILSECLQWVHVVHAAVNRTIRWRSRRYRVVRSDCFYPVDAPQ